MRVPIKVMSLVLAALLASGCVSLRKETTPEPAPASDASSSETVEELRAENRQQAVTLLANQVEIEQLQERLQSQHAMLEEAIQEVVRARAKQRSVQSRAQAAAEIAEAEIALERLSEAARGAAVAEQARKLLASASKEYESENFGGALYLVNQSKNRIRLAGLSPAAQRVDSGEASVADETVFGYPVPLSVTKRSNFREGPGTEFPVLSTIDAGTTLMGHASKGSWIRAQSPDGMAGWIHNSLVDGS